MKKKWIAIEHHYRTKEIWEVDEDYDLERCHPQFSGGARKISYRIREVSPTVFRDMSKDEGFEPSPDPASLARAEQGYWSRLMKAWKSSLKG